MARSADGQRAPAHLSTKKKWPSSNETDIGRGARTDKADAKFESESPHQSLASYGTNSPQQFQQTATFVHKILNGAKPADLPVEQPTKFEACHQCKNGQIAWPHDSVIATRDRRRCNWVKFLLRLLTAAFGTFETSRNACVRSVIQS
jgi:hypothetical protein